MSLADFLHYINIFKLDDLKKTKTLIVIDLWFIFFTLKNALIVISTNRIMFVYNK